MKCSVEKLSSNKVKLSFEVESDLFDQGLEKAYRKTVGRFAIPGFRKGKAPRKVIEMHYGAGVFYEDAFDAIFPDVYQQAVKENNLQPVDRPEIEVQNIKAGEALTFTAEVFVRPDVTMGDYKAIRVEKTEVSVTEDDVKAEIERARERVARHVDVTDRPVKLDDEITLDYSGECEGVKFDGGTAQDQKLVIGSGSFIPGFEDQLVGVAIGEEKDVSVTFPEQYHAENLAGKPAIFHCKVKAISEKELPELDDAFAADVSDFETFADYKADVQKRLTEEAERRNDSAFENEVLEKVVEVMEADIPNGMIESQIDNMLREMEIRMMYQGLKMQDYLKYTGQTMEQVREMYKDQATERVKTRLMLEEVRKLENIEASESDVEAQIAPDAERAKKTVEEYKGTLTEADIDYYKEIAVVKNTIDLLKKIALGE